MVTIRCVLLGIVVCGACAAGDPHAAHVLGSDPFGPHTDANVTAIGIMDGGGAPAGVPEPSGSNASASVAASPDLAAGCVQLSDWQCVDLTSSGGRFCADARGPIDVIFVNGRVVEVICYPPSDDSKRPLEIVAVRNDDGDLKIAANDTTVIFGLQTDGVPIEGNLEVRGDNVTIYGNGPDNSIIHGDVVFDGNDIRLRGVTVVGDLIIRNNSTAVVLSVIMGDLELAEGAGSHNLFVANTVFGAMRVPTGHNILSQNRIGGDWRVSGSDNLCDDNRAFDADDPRSAGDESGSQLRCEG